MFAKVAEKPKIFPQKILFYEVLFNLKHVKRNTDKDTYCNTSQWTRYIF